MPLYSIKGVMLLILYIMDKEQTPLDVIDSYFSYIWTEEYGKCGTFELYLPMRYIKNEILMNGRYLYSEGMGNSTLMVIEDIQINAKSDGDQMVLTGRSLESLLDRRIIWEEPTISNTSYETIKRMIFDNVISPETSKRAIPDFIFEESTDTSVLSVTTPYLEPETLIGENLYSVVSDICLNSNLGFKIKPNFKGGFIFSLYSGRDRTVSQTINPPIIFSSKLETLLGCDYFNSSRDVKNSVLVWGPTEDIYDEETGEVVDTIRHAYEEGDSSGLDRREGFVETGSVEEDTDIGEYMTYKAEEFLSEYNKPIITFNGELNTLTQYQYKRDYDIGDIVEVINDYDVRCVCRITEVVYSYSEEGRVVLPTFTNISDNLEGATI